MRNGFSIRSLLWIAPIYPRTLSVSTSIDLVADRNVARVGLDLANSPNVIHTEREVMGVSPCHLQWVAIAALPIAEDKILGMFAS